VRVTSSRHTRSKLAAGLIIGILLLVALGACGETGDSAPTSAPGTASSLGDQSSSTNIESTTASALSLHDRVQQERAGTSAVAPATTVTSQVNQHYRQSHHDHG
jgi:hypothetical protein